MGTLTEAVKDLEDYLTKKSEDTSSQVGSFAVVAKTGPVGQSTNAIKSTALSKILGDLADNPIVQMGIDTLTQIVTTAVQQVVTDALSKINFSAIENATQNFMQIWATVSTFQAEVAMELARNSGRNILTLLDKKDAVIADIQAEVIALHNACNLLVNSGTFMSDYVKGLIQAYNILLTAQVKFNQVSKGLKNEAAPRFLTKAYSDGVASLQSAQKLVLPDRGADVTSIRGVKTLVETTVARQSNQQAVAAALAIPGISARIGLKMVEYVKLTVEINLLLTTFIEALDDWITSFSQNNNIYKVALDHLTAGMNQLTDLTDSMKAALFVTTGSNPKFDPSSVLFGVNVSAQATLWGIKLQGIIQWMKLNPGVGAAAVDKTANSVQLYTKAINLLSGYSSIAFTGGTLKIENSAEDPTVSLGYVTSLLLKVNMLVATRSSKSQVIAIFRPVDGMLTASKQHITRMRTAITPFVQSGSNLPGPAAKLMSQALGVANQYGLDRVVGLMNNGKIKELFALTPQNSTYAGAAVAGLNKIAEDVRANKNASDAQVAKIEALRDTVNADKTAKEIEANRAYAGNADAAQEKLKKENKADKAKIQPALETAKQLDTAAGTSTTASAETKLAGVTPGFNSFKSALGL